MRIDGSRGDQSGTRHEIVIVVDDENHAGQQEREKHQTIPRKYG